MRLRLIAARCILKLATCKAFSSEINTHFDLLAWVAAVCESRTFFEDCVVADITYIMNLPGSQR